MKKLAIGLILTFILAALIAAAGCTAPGSSATAPAPASSTAPVSTPAPVSSAATPESVLLLGKIQVKTLDGVNEALEYVAMKDVAEKTESLESFTEAGVLADKFWDLPAMAQAGGSGQVRANYSVVDDTRTATVDAAIGIMKEYETNKTVTAASLRKFEDEFEAMRASYSQFTAVYYAMLPAESLDTSTATGAAIALQKMQVDLLVSVSESLEHVIIMEPEEMEEFNTAMNRFNSKAEAFNATPFLRARGNEDIARHYREMRTAVKEFRDAANNIFAEYDVRGKNTPQTLVAYEAATDNLRQSYNTLMASVLEKT